METESSVVAESLDKRLAELLQEAGYKAKISEIGGVKSAVSGMNITVYPFENDTIQVISAIKMPDGWEPDYQLVNSHNLKYRYAKVFIDDEGDLVLSGDFIVDFDEPQAADRHITKAMEIFDGALSLLRDTLKAIDPGASED